MGQNVANNLNNQVVVVFQCEYCFKPEDWKPTENMAYDQTSPLQVSAVKSQRLDEPSIYFIDFEPFFYSDEYEDKQDALWTDYQMNDIAVSVIHNYTVYIIS